MSTNCNIEGFDKSGSISIFQLLIHRTFYHVIDLDE